MSQYFARRVLLFIPTIMLATIMVFGLFWIVPGDAAMMILTGAEGDSAGRVTDEDLAKLRADLALDRPVVVRSPGWPSRL